MPVTINGSVLTQTDVTSPSPSTLTFTSTVLTAGDIVVVTVAENSPSTYGTASAPTGGTGLSWTQIILQQNTASHFSEVWAYWTAVPSDQTSTITVTTTNTSDVGTAAALYRLSGADQITPIGLTDGFQGQTDPTGTDLQLTGTLAGSLIIAAASDWSAGTASLTITISNTTSAATDLNNLESGQFRALSNHGSQSGSTNQGTYDYSAATGDWAAIIFEVKAAPSAAAAYTPPDTFLPDASLLDLADDTGDPALGFLYRAPDYSPVLIPAFVSPSNRPRLRGVFLRRAEAVSPVLTQVAVPAAPSYVQDPGRHELRGWLQRRSRIATVPAPQVAPAPPSPHPRRVFAGFRRSKSVTPVPPQVTPPAPPAYPWQALGQRRRGAWRRRPQAPMPVPAQQAAPTAPPYVPQLKEARRVQAAPRRGRAAVPTPTVQPVPVAITRRRFTLSGKRRQQVTPVPPQIVVVPPVYPKQPVRRRIIAILLRRPGRLHTPVPPQVGPPPIIDANGWVVVTQTVVSGVDASSAASGQAGVDQSVTSTAFGSSSTDGRTSVDPTSDGRAEVG